MYRRHCRCNDGDGGIITFIAMIIIALYALPIVGIYQLVARKSADSKVLGGVLLVVGIILWIMIGIG